MEIVIPPRDHASSTYKFTYDGHGDVMQVQKVRGEQAGPVERARKGRHFAPWPFQSVVTETTVLSSPTTTTTHTLFGRRATWQPKRPGRDSDADSVFRDLIPDYIINYIRGETPESVARRNKNGGKLGERGVEIAHQHRIHRSNAAQLEGIESRPGSRSTASTIDEDDEEQVLTGWGKSRTGRNWRLFTFGWRSGVAWNALLSLLLLIVVAVAIVVGIIRVSLFSGDSIIFAGTCSTAKKIDWVLHAVISAFSMVLLAGASYTFQVLSSPTRAEVDKAHGRKKWLDIGIPSIRNLAHMDPKRVVMATVLLVAAVSLPAVYHAVVINTQLAVGYNLLFVTESFAAGSSFSNDTARNAASLSRLDILALQSLATQQQLTNLTTAQCLEAFGGAFEAGFSDVLLVTDTTSPTTSLLQTAEPGSLLTDFVRTGTLGALTVAFDGSTVQYCLAAPTATGPTCKLGLNGALLGATAGVILVIVIVILCTLFIKFEPLATLGDAVASFLKEPDATTQGCCLITKRDVCQGRWDLREMKYWDARNDLWITSPSLSRWVLVGLIWVTSLGLAVASLIVSMDADFYSGLTPLGIASNHALVTLPSVGSKTTTAMAGALIANLPQLLLATLYLAVNSLMSTYYLSHELSLFAVDEPRPLRVSAGPEGQQTASLYLTLPRPWSWFLTILFAGAGFVLSQSVSLVSAELPHPPSSDAPAVLAVGVSGLGLVIILALLMLLAIIVVPVLGLRRAPNATAAATAAVTAAAAAGDKEKKAGMTAVRGNPLALPTGSCSAVIAARCQRAPAESETDPWARPLVWGVVHEGEGTDASHCAFTAGPAGKVVAGKSYA